MITLFVTLRYAIMPPAAKVSFESVADAAQALAAANLPITNRAVRAHLGHIGSAGTIAKHLADWREARQPGLVLPASVTSAIEAYLAQLLAQTQAAWQQERTDLLATIADLEQSNGELSQSVASLTGRQQEISQALAKRIGAMEQLQTELENERTAHRKAAALAASADTWRTVREQDQQRHQAEIEALRTELARQNNAAHTTGLAESAEP